MIQNIYDWEYIYWTYMFIGAIDLGVHILKIYIKHILLQYMFNI